MTTAMRFQDEFSLGHTGDFLRTLWQLNHVLERTSRRMEAVWGVTSQQRMIIRYVGRYPGMTAGQLATHFHLDPGTVSAALDRLEQKGLIERRRSARDKRRVVLGLTPDGRAIDASVVGLAEQALNALLETLPPEDVECARHVLASLASRIETALK